MPARSRVHSQSSRACYTLDVLSACSPTTDSTMTSRPSSTFPPMPARSPNLAVSAALYPPASCLSPDSNLLPQSSSFASPFSHLLRQPILSSYASPFSHLLPQSRLALLALFYNHRLLPSSIPHFASAHTPTSYLSAHSCLLPLSIPRLVPSTSVHTPHVLSYSTTPSCLSPQSHLLPSSPLLPLAPVLTPGSLPHTAASCVSPSSCISPYSHLLPRPTLPPLTATIHNHYPQPTTTAQRSSVTLERRPLSLARFLKHNHHIVVGGIVSR